MNTVNEVIKQIISHLNTADIIDVGNGLTIRVPVNHITCNDGTTLSIQAGAFLFCKPRRDKSPWTHVEVMALDENFVPIHIDQDHYNNGVYAYVPIEQVAMEIIARKNLRLT